MILSKILIAILLPQILWAASGSLSFYGKGQKEIHASVFGESAVNGSVVFSIGLGESESTYEELINDLLELGYGPIYIMDHRFQGRSGPLKSQRAYVGKFQDYVDDFSDFVENQVQPHLKKKGISQRPMLLAHSMGGQIAAQYLSKDQNQGHFKKVAYVAPMFGIQFSDSLNPEKNPLVKALLISLSRLAPKSRPPLTPDEEPSFSENTNTSNEERYWAKMNPLVESGANLVNVTNRWVYESLIATLLLKTQLEAFEIPSLVLGAELDELVDLESLRNFACNTKNCSFFEIKGSRHGIHIEDDLYRNQMLGLTHGFFSENSQDQLLAKACSLLF